MMWSKSLTESFSSTARLVESARSNSTFMLENDGNFGVSTSATTVTLDFGETYSLSSRSMECRLEL